MSQKCTYKHPLILDGTDQNSRMLKSIDPTFVQLDEKTMADYLLFAQNLARHLKFVNINGEEDGDWQNFFDRDVSVIIAEIVNWPIQRYYKFMDQRWLNLTDLPAVEPEKNLKFIFDFIFTQCALLDRYQQLLPEKTGLKTQLQNQIRSTFTTRFGRLLSYYKGAVSEGLIDDSATDIPEQPPVEWKLSAVILEKGFSRLWTSEDHPDWPSFLSATTADAAPFGDPLLSNEERIRYAASYNLLVSAVTAMLEGLAQARRTAARFLKETLTEWPAHAPNMALFIAFLKLYNESKKELNTFTKRHLDFYYKEVLRMNRKPPSPARANVTFTLSKPTDNYPLNADTLLKAGKDPSGNPINFATLQATALNKATVKEIKQIYFDPNDQYLPYIGPVANSFDGLGADNPEGVIGWDTFGNTDRPLGELGFALASKLLFLQEGTRTIDILLTFKQAHQLVNTQLSGNFILMFTTEEGWLTVNNATVTRDDNFKIKINVELEGDQPAILPYSKEIHGGQFDTSHPIVKILLKNEKNGGFHDVLKKLRRKALSNINLTIDVDDFKSIAVSTDAGPQDPSQPFLAFGALPKSGNAIILGSNEIFSKPLTGLSVGLRWKNYPGAGKVRYPFNNSASNPSFSLNFLEKGIWKNGSLSNDASEKPFDGSSRTITVNNSEGFPKTETNYVENLNFQNTSRSGFIRLKLSGDFGHIAKQKQLIVNLVEKAKEDATLGTGDILDDPYTPEVEEIYFNYTASTGTWSLNSGTNYKNRVLQYFHVGPFGEAEQHPKILREDKNVYCLPQFYQEGNNEGELFIGLENLKALQKVAILFQIVEGSANPLKEKPEDHVKWSFLSNNVWVPFKKEEVADSTDGLINSGIITFTLPKEATTNNTLLANGLLWIKAGVNEDIDLVCRHLGIHAQAVLSVFKNNKNNLSFLGTPLEAGSINKLEKRVPQVKKVEQLYPTFGGQGLESNARYYTRVSERLRHKKRCVTMWDYERMILENFPEIFLVKCISHTQKEAIGATTEFKYNELAPGHVLIIPIARIRSTELADRLKPYTSLGLLKRIEKFVLKYVSPFVKLHVRNPEFNELKVECKITFQGELDRTTYENRLEEELISYLSPWAFSQQRTIAFGGKWHASTIIDFIEERPYVDYLTDFKLKQIVNGIENEVKEAVVDNASAILVSHIQHVFHLPDPC